MKPTTAFGVIAALAAAALALPASGQQGAECVADGCPGMDVYTEAMAALERGQYDEACPKLHKATQLKPSARVRHELAKCYEAQGRIAAACREYDRTAAEARRDNEESLVTLALASAERLEAQLSSVALQIDDRPLDLQISIDGEVMDTRSAFEGLLRLEPGPHRIQASASGFVTFDTTVEGPVGETIVVAIELKGADPSVFRRPEPEQDEAPPRTGIGPVGVLGLVLGGFGAGAVIAGGVMQFLHDSQSARVDADPALCGGDAGCTELGRQERDSATEKQIAAGVLFVAGGIVLLTGLTIILLDVSAVSAPPKKTVWLEPFIGGARVRAQF